MTTPYATAMHAVVGMVQPIMKSAGFRKRRNAFNRQAAAGVVQVVSFQMGPFEPPGTVEIPGLRENLYGTFTVNLGVYLDEVRRIQDLPQAGNFINDYNCHLRRRLGQLIDPPADRWWDLDGHEETGHVVRDLISGPALDWLNQHASWTSILDALEAAPPSSRAVSGNPDRLLATRMRLAENDMAAAQRNFSAWKATVEPWHSHYGYLRELATRHELDFET
jgi:hypothetical protein